MGNKIGSKKSTITITKDNKVLIGSPNALANYLKVTGETVRNWIKAGHKVKADNGYVVQLDCEIVKR